MINYNKEASLTNIKYNILSFFSQNKTILFLIASFIVLSLLTGLFTGIKLYNISGTINPGDYSFVTIVSGDIYSVSIFIKRFLSTILVIGLCIIFSINRWLSIFGFLLICYRAFLLALNCTFIIIYLGIGGAINSVLIIFPCQIISLLIISIMFVISLRAFKLKAMCGKLNGNYFKWLMLSIILAFTTNIIEALLLLTFKSTTLLII